MSRPDDQCTRCGKTGHRASQCKQPTANARAHLGHKPGTYLGGVIDRDSLMARCRIDGECGCWVWGLSYSQGSPRVHLRLEDGAQTVMRGRAAAWYIRTGQRVPRGLFSWATDACEHDGCVNPDHVRIGTRAQWGEWLSQRGTMKNKPNRIAANRQNVMSRRKLTPAQVDEIRSGDESISSLAARFGVTPNTVWAVRTMQTYKPQAEMQGASVFAWRPA